MSTFCCIIKIQTSNNNDKTQLFGNCGKHLRLSVFKSWTSILSSAQMPLKLHSASARLV